MSALAIRNATIIDGTGKDPQPNSTIVIDANGTITSVGPDTEITVPQGVRVLDGTDRYVIPGLMDANVHLVGCRTADTLLEFEGRYHELALEAAQLTLKYGVTTVFDTWGAAGPVSEARDAIRDGRERGSHIYYSGNIIGLGGPLSPDFVDPGTFLQRDTIDRINQTWERGTGPELTSLTAEQLGDRIAAYIEDTGVDFVKWASTDHSSAPGNFYMFTDRMQRAIVDTSRRYGKTVQAHTTTVESLHSVVDLDADVLQHGDITAEQTISPELIAKIVEKRLPTAALIVTDDHLAWNQTSPATVGEMRMMRANADINQRNLIDAGARLLLTTDGFAYGPRITNHPGFRAGTLSPDVPELPIQLGYSHFNWIKGAWQRGMNPMEVLRSATAYIAEAYAVDNIVGTLQPGKRGDLVMLTQNPLKSHAAYRAIEHVVQAGAVVDRDTLATDMHLAADVIAEHRL